MAPKRKRGAQPGNTNALKHGLYARHLTPEQRAALARARELDPEDLREEIALVRARLAALHDPEGEHLALVLQAARTIAHLAATRHRLSPRAANELSDAIARVIEGVGTQLGAFDPPSDTLGP